MKNLVLIILFLIVSFPVFAQEKGDSNMVRPVPGSTRHGNNPVIFLIGNSTMRNGTYGNGNKGKWGWGYYAREYFDTNKVTVENHAFGGTSPRTFYDNPDHWKRVLPGIRKGDYVFLELGHNDSGAIDSVRARSCYKPFGKTSLDDKDTVVFNKVTNRIDTVHTFGWYIRAFVRDTRAKGGIPILFTLTPRKVYNADSVTIQRNYLSPYIFELGKELNVPVVDLNEISSRKLDSFSKWKVNYYFYGDKIHTSVYGARMNALSAAEGLENLVLSDSLFTDEKVALQQLKSYLVKEKLHSESLDKRLGLNDKPRVFLCGDSTGKNNDIDPNGKWGWGSQGYTVFDSLRCTFINCAMAGRSLRRYIDEDRWDAIYRILRPGDFVLIQFGHNDFGAIDKGKERADIACEKDSSNVYTMASNGKYVVVYSYGWYLRKIIDECKEKGAIPVILSFTPRNEWHKGAGKIHGVFCPVKEKKSRMYIERRNDNCIPQWDYDIAMECGVEFVDVHNITADFLDKECGCKENAMKYYSGDHTHTSLLGAKMNAKSVAKGLRKIKSPLLKWVK